MRFDVETIRESGFYSEKRWIEVRDFVRDRDDMICAICGETIYEKPEVDHIIPLTWENVTNWDIAYNPDNLQLLHHDCHTRKTRRDKKTRNRLFY